MYNVAVLPAACASVQNIRYLAKEDDIMKKLFAVLLTLTFVLTLAACGKKEEAAPAGPEPGTPLSTFYQGILDAQPEDAEELMLFEESNPDLIGSFYIGLADVELSQQTLYMHPIAATPCEIMLAEVKNADDVQAVADIFQARIDMGADDAFYPENAEGWANNAHVQVSGNFVCMIVLPEVYTIPENVFAVS